VAAAEAAAAAAAAGVPTPPAFGEAPYSLYAVKWVG
jgi:hypothetical protein